MSERKSDCCNAEVIDDFPFLICKACNHICNFEPEKVLSKEEVDLLAVE
jgi:hypothetical protein